METNEKIVYITVDSNKLLNIKVVLDGQEVDS